MKRITLVFAVLTLALLAGCSSEGAKEGATPQPQGAPAMSSDAQSQMNAAQQADAARRARGTAPR